MSSLIMYTVPPAGDIQQYAECRNSWGGAIRVWTALAERYVYTTKAGTMERDSEVGRLMWRQAFKPVFELVDDPRLSRCERLVLGWTFDRVICERDKSSELAHALEQFSRLHRMDGLNHLLTIAGLLRECQERTDIVGTAYQHTTVAQTMWHVHADDRAYDHSRDFDREFDSLAKPWFLFEAIELANDDANRLVVA